MGEAELDIQNKLLIIHSHIITYGDAANEALAEQMRDEIETMWNEPDVSVEIRKTFFQVRFKITAAVRKDITELEVYQNVDPRNNYFRVEVYAKNPKDDISMVDGVPCNSGFFKQENLYKGSTTAAHEYGHTIGLDHPKILDIRGQDVPGIMYPRGTLVDPQFQYEPTFPAGVKGGTMHPIYRKVRPLDILNLKLHKLRFTGNKAIVGDFTNIYHWGREDL